MNYKQPQIGTRTTYLRHEGETLEVFEGVGIVVSVFLDQDCRAMVRVKDGENMYNVHIATLGYDHSFIAVYEDALQAVKRTADEGTAVQTATCSQYNEIVAQLTSEAFGEPLVIEGVSR